MIEAKREDILFWNQSWEGSMVLKWSCSANVTLRHYFSVNAIHQNAMVSQQSLQNITNTIHPNKIFNICQVILASQDVLVLNNLSVDAWDNLHGIMSLVIWSDPTGHNYKLMISGALGSNCLCQLHWVGAYPRPQMFLFCFKQSVWDHLQFDLIPLETITSW